MYSCLRWTHPSAGRAGSFCPSSAGGGGDDCPLPGFRRAAAGLYRNILADMLAGIDPGHVKVRIQVSNLEFPEHMCALIVRPSYYHGENYLRGELTGKLARHL